MNQGILVSYIKMYYNFREAKNLVDSIRNVVYKGRLRDTELFVFTDNWVFESVFYEGNSNITLLFEIVLPFILHVVHISVTSMI